MLKKEFYIFILIVIATSVGILNKVQADELHATNKLSGFYLKAGTGVNKISPIKIENSDFKGRIKLANNFPLMELGLGYRLTDTIRTELVFDYYFLFHSNETSRDQDNNIYKIAYKTKINTLMVNAYKDIITIDKFTPFIGGGIGLNTLKDKATGNAISADGENTISLNPSHSKQVHRFVYKLTAGVDVKLCDNVNAELSYNYFNLGRNRPRVIEGVDNIVRRSYQVHNLTLGVRYAF